MSGASDGGRAVAYVASKQDGAIVADLVDILQCHRAEASSPLLLLSEGGQRIELARPILDALRQIALALSQGCGVTVVPHDALLTTQETADVLGVSRPTLVRLLDEGLIAHQMRWRHRRVALSDVIDYQRRSRLERRQILDDMAAEGQASGLYDAAPLPIETTR